jgi:2-amino-4-hydroxy-6-hydroxymethyldihydropteridine diphosphokinase
MAQVYVSIGSNIERERNIETALQALAAAYGELQQSSVYESAAIGFDSAPFYNLVVGFQTGDSPQAVQETLHCIEDSQGRLLGPLAEIAGERRHPVSGVRYADLWSAFDATGQELQRIDWPAAIR